MPGLAVTVILSVISTAFVFDLSLPKVNVFVRLAVAVVVEVTVANPTVPSTSTSWLIEKPASIELDQEVVTSEECHAPGS